MDTLNLIIIFTGISFLVYGVNSFYSNKMISEFERWGLKERRKLIACFQLLCGSMLLLGIKHNPVLIISSIMLIIMMLVAIYVRIKIRDDISEILPAVTFFILGIIILQYSL